jgi:hypothetical protein
MMVLQQLGLFEVNSSLQKLPSAFIFSHSFIPCSFSSWLLNRFFFFVENALLRGLGDSRVSIKRFLFV